MIFNYLINKWKSGKVIRELKNNGFELHAPYSITNIAHIKYTPPHLRWAGFLDGIKRYDTYWTRDDIRP